MLAAVGRGEMSADQADALLQGREARDARATPAALTAPAAGLFLEGVFYDGDAGPGPLEPMFPIEP